MTSTKEYDFKKMSIGEILLLYKEGKITGKQALNAIQPKPISGLKRKLGLDKNK